VYSRRHEWATLAAVFGIVFILYGFSIIFSLLPGLVVGRGTGVLIVPGMMFFVGVAFLIGVAIFKATEGARRREGAIRDSQDKVEEVTETMLEDRELVGSCIVCKGYLYAGDSIASCPRCRGIAHRGTSWSGFTSKGLVRLVGGIWTKIRCKNSGQKENEAALFQ
jgi:hypothetical protein